jgi:hypothetical protein
VISRGLSTIIINVLEKIVFRFSSIGSVVSENDV